MPESHSTEDVYQKTLEDNQFGRLFTVPGNRKRLTSAWMEHSVPVISSQAGYFAPKARQVP